MPRINLSQLGRTPRDTARTRRLANRLNRAEVDADGVTIVVDAQGNLSIQVSADPGNVLEIRDDGLFAEPTLPGEAAGDLFVWDGTGLQRLPVGADGQVLTADSSEPLGVRWADPAAPDPDPESGFSAGFSNGFGAPAVTESGFSAGFSDGFGGAEAPEEMAFSAGFSDGFS